MIDLPTLKVVIESLLIVCLILSAMIKFLIYLNMSTKAAFKFLIVFFLALLVGQLSKYYFGIDLTVFMGYFVCLVRDLPFFTRYVERLFRVRYYAG